MAASSISRIKKIIFFAPQEVSHWSLWTISEPNDTQTAASVVKASGIKALAKHRRVKVDERSLAVVLRELSGDARDIVQTLLVRP